MGQGYTRNDTSNNIADGNVINASDLDGEFNAVDAAFNESSGHTHDGTADEGAPVTVLGPVQDFVASATEIKPKTSNTLDIGTASLQFKDMYLDGSAYIDGLGEDILVATDKKVQFRDTALFINSSTDGQLDIAADTEVEITTALVEISADATVGDDLTLKSDAAVLGFGADTDVTLTHVADTGLLVNAAMVVQFRDSAINIGSPADGELDINADSEIELNSTLIDINGNVEISGTLSQTGIATFTDDIIIGDGKTIGSASDADAITIASNGQLTLTQTLIGTALDISGDIDVDGTTNLDVVDIDGAVDMASTLQVDGAITSSAGATITTADNTTQLTLTSTDADASVGPRFDLKRDSGSPADSDNLGRMRYLFDNDAAEQTEGVRVDAVLTDASDGTEDVSYVIDTMIAGTLRERIGLGATETVINEDNRDIDFRIEGGSSTHALFLQGSNDFIGINESSPQNALHITTSDFKALQLEGPRPTAFLKETGATADENFQIRLDGGHLLFQTQNNAQSSASTKVSVLQTGGISFNGDTATANALDDYEEGTWTPAMSSSSGTAPSPASASGIYTKIGREVTVSAIITNITKGGTDTAVIQVGGLPFTPNTQDSFGACLFGQVTFSDPEVTGQAANVDASADIVRFFVNKDGAARALIDNQHIGSGASDLYFTISYITSQ